MVTDPCALTEGCGNIWKMVKRDRNGSRGRACGGPMDREASAGFGQGEGGSSETGGTSFGRAENPETRGMV